ncbi:hypothetical protein QLF84_23930, partial [Salmonella enterica subsp. enterica serovar Oslo]|nr:hypothetical protein [Salmonella enterica subsp. enterica serovar Oslo]
MNLYITNNTYQRLDFAWLKPETGVLVYNPIHAGSQAVVFDFTRAEIDVILQQHADYGLIDATKLDQNR